VTMFPDGLIGMLRKVRERLKAPSAPVSKAEGGTAA